MLHRLCAAGSARDARRLMGFMALFAGGAWRCN